MNAFTSISRLLDADQTVLIDGATGTELERRGAVMHDRTWCAMATATAPDILRRVHEDYIRAGARVIYTNTFSSSLTMLAAAGLADRFETLNRDAVRIAREAREAAGCVDSVAIAGSVSHQLPMHLGVGDRRDRSQLPEPTVIRDNARRLLAILVDAGVDLIGLEMMYDPRLATPTIEAALETGLPVWLGLSARAGTDGAPGAYFDASVPFATVLDALLPAPVQALGVMHSNVNVTGPALDLVRARWDGPLMVYPDSGHFVAPHWHFENVIAPHDLVAHVERWRAIGARIVGGCCGIGLEHIEALARALAAPPRVRGSSSEVPPAH